MDGFGRLAVLGAAALLTACGDATSDAPPDPATSETATTATDPVEAPTAGGLAQLPVGDPPATADVEAGAATRIPAPGDGLAVVWLTTSGVLALESDGSLVVLGDGEPADARGERWRDLVGERTLLGLPDGLQVDGVVAEDRRTVLVDVTDDAGNRAWVRCHVGLLACAIAAELEPDDVVPQ